MGCGDFVGGEGAGGFEEPIEDAAQLGGARSAGGGGQIVVGVLHRARQDVQLVVQLVECRSGDHQLALAQVELAGALPGDPVPLPATLRAELGAGVRVRPSRAALGGTTGSAGFPS